MRNKFSELVAQGVAAFQYTPILQETPCNDPICREYNNIFGPAIDTHMSMLEDGSRVITGHLIDDEQEWTKFTFSTMWNGVDFTKSGYNTLNEFLSRFNLTFRKACLNGDIVMKVVEFQAPTEMEPVTNENVNKSEIEQILNEAKALKLDTFINFDLQSDIYNALGDLAKEYNFHNKNFDEKDVKKALDWFMKNFFVDESLMESKDCIACDKETIKNVMQDLEDEGYDISVIHDILSDNYKELDSLIRKPNKLLLKFVLGINPNPGKHLDVEGSINAAKKAWKIK